MHMQASTELRNAGPEPKKFAVADGYLGSVSVIVRRLLAHQLSGSVAVHKLQQQVASGHKAKSLEGRLKTRIASFAEVLPLALVSQAQHD